jgi:two-component system cell cycle response regulator DivK
MTKLLILIVDDSDRNRKLVRDVLRHAGMGTIEGATGEVGLALARTRRPDLVLLDLRLPDYDGSEVVRRLASDPKTAAIPVVAVTAVGGAGTELREAGFADYIEKPLDVVELPERVRRLAGGSPPSDREAGTLDAACDE